jgi:hypothetical protein
MGTSPRYFKILDVYDGSCGSRRHLIEFPREKSQVEKRSYSICYIKSPSTESGATGLQWDNELEKKKGGCVCIWRVTGTMGTRTTSSGSSHAISTESTLDLLD